MTVNIKKTAWGKRSLGVSASATLLAMIMLYGTMFTLVCIHIATRSAKEVERNSSAISVDSAEAGIELALDNYSDMSRLIMLNSDVEEYLRCEEPDGTAAAHAVSGIFSITNIFDYVDSVYVLRSDGMMVNTSQGINILDRTVMQEEQWQKALERGSGNAVIMVNAGGAVRKSNGQPLISIVRNIFDTQTIKPTGVLIVNLSADMLMESLRSSHMEGVSAIYDMSGNLLCGSKTLDKYFSKDSYADGTNTVAIKSDGKKYILTCSTCRDALVLLNLRKVGRIELFTGETGIILLMLAVAFLLSVTVCFIFISRDVTHPIKELAEAMEQTGWSGSLSKLSLELPSAELVSLAESYNKMIDYQNELVGRLIEKEKNVQRAEMRVLHEQIKPHFLYNSLESISCLALSEGAQEAYNAIETLGSFYRNFLSKGDREIPIRRELNITRDYLSLQKLRYKDAFEDEYDVDDDVLDIKIPKLILQPLVENSIYHGVRLKGETGIIRVSAKRTNEDYICISVYDSGIGMSAEQIEQVLSGDAYDECDELSGFGLRGTIARIRYYAGENVSVNIRSEQGEYTEIEIIFKQAKENCDVQSDDN